MTLALRTVIDIPETDLASFLHDVIVARPKSSGEDDSMQVDSAANPSIPSLPDLLALCVTYPTSAAAMRVAVRKHLREADGLVDILEILLEWVERWCSEEMKFFPEKARKNERGFLVPVVENHKIEDIPPLDKVCPIAAVVGSRF